MARFVDVRNGRCLVACLLDVVVFVFKLVEMIVRWWYLWYSPAGGPPQSSSSSVRFVVLLDLMGRDDGENKTRKSLLQLGWAGL